MRILVTRPHPAAAATARRLEALGHQTIQLPLMRALPLPEQARDALTAEFDALAITSAEALRVLDAAGNAHLSKPIYCVGAATADAAAQLGFQAILTGTGDGEGLAHTIASSLKRTGKILYLAGTPRSPAFEASLAKAGIPCHVAEIYRMMPIAYPDGYLAKLLVAERPDTVLLYSCETAKRFLMLLDGNEEEIRTLRILCLSRAIADILPAGHPSVLVAENPDETSLFRLL